jgi:hypothetical protein
MHKALLSSKERRQIEAYLRQDGNKNINIRQLAFRARKYLPQIRGDMTLLEKLLSRYEKEVRDR